MENIVLNFEGKIVNCNFERGKRKNLYIVVKENGIVEIRAPKRMSVEEITKFIKSKQKWIYEKVIESEKRAISKQESKSNGIYKILGKEYTLEKIFKDVKRSSTSFDDNKIKMILPKNLENDESLNDLIELNYNKLIAKIAEVEVPQSINRITNLVGISPKELKIRNFKRAWGNCSSKKVISINKDVCKFSRDAIDYVCLHEVCHLKYMNHSKDFWNMVEYYMPEYRGISAELK